MVLADREHVEPELVCQFNLLHQLVHALARADTRGEVCEGRDAEFHKPSIAKVLARASISPDPLAPHPAVEPASNGRLADSSSGYTRPSSGDRPGGSDDAQLLLLLAAAASAALLAACGGGSNSTTTTTGSTPTSTTSTTRSAAAKTTSSSSSAAGTTTPSLGGAGAAVAAYCSSALAAAKTRLSASETSQFESYCSSLANDSPTQIKAAEKTLCTEIIKDTVPAADRASVSAVCAKL
jgi:hypothetical protein